MKLNIALQVDTPKHNSRKFGFRYFKRPTTAAAPAKT
jgi:hypothetical protein